MIKYHLTSKALLNDILPVIVQSRKFIDAPLHFTKDWSKSESRTDSDPLAQNRLQFSKVTSINSL